MEKYSMLLGRKDKYGESEYTTKCNLQIQFGLYQITNGIFHRTRTKNFTIHMETQKTLYSQSSLEKEEWGWRNQPSCLQIILQSYSNQDSMVQFSSVQSLSHVQLFATPCIAACRPPCPSPTPGVYSNSCPSNQWCHPAISSSVVPFSSCPQSLPSSGSFPMSQLFAWGGQSIGVSASASVLPMNTHDWSPVGWTGWTSLQSKGISRVFSNTTVQKHQFFSAQLSSQSNSHIHTWPLEKP